MAVRPLVVMALAEESQGLIEKAGFEVHYTGVGKVNATYALMRKMAEARQAGNPVTHVINLGSAGSPRFKTGEVVGADHFLQRDMDATGLGFRHGETPFDIHPFILEFQPFFTTLPHGTCGSGDSFLQGPSPVECDIIDMEAYAFAKICHMESIPFACVKYITDGADGNAHLDWQENVRLAAQAFIPLLRAYTS